MLSVDASQKGNRENFGATSSQYLTLTVDNPESAIPVLENYAKMNSANVIKRVFNSSRGAEQDIRVYGYFGVLSESMKDALLIDDNDRNLKFIKSSDFRLSTESVNEEQRIMDILDNDKFEVLPLQTILRADADVAKGIYFVYVSTDIIQSEKDLEALGIGNVSRTVQTGSNNALSGFVIYVFVQIFLLFVALFVIHYIYYLEMSSKTIGIFKLYSTRFKLFYEIVGSNLIILCTEFLLASIVLYIILPQSVFLKLLMLLFIECIVIIFFYFVMYCIKVKLNIVSALKNKTNNKGVLILFKVALIINLAISSVFLYTAISEKSKESKKLELESQLQESKEYGQLQFSKTFIENNIVNFQNAKKSELLDAYPIFRENNAILLNNYFIQEQILYDEARKNNCRGEHAEICTSNQGENVLLVNEIYMNRYLQQIQKNSPQFNENENTIRIYVHNSYNGNTEELLKKVLPPEKTPDGTVTIQNMPKIEIIKVFEEYSVFTFVGDIQYVTVSNPIIMSFSTKAIQEIHFDNLELYLYIPLIDGDKNKTFSFLESIINNRELIGEKGAFDSIQTKNEQYNQFLQNEQFVRKVFGFQFIILSLFLIILIWQYIASHIASRKKEIAILKLAGNTLLKRHLSLFRFLTLAWILAVMTVIFYTTVVVNLDIIAMAINVPLSLLGIYVYMLSISIIFVIYQEKKSVTATLKGE